MADQPVDHDRQRRAVVAGQERRGAELAQRDGEGEAGRGQQRLPDDRQVDGRAARAAGAAPSEAAAWRCRSSMPASTGTSVRTTSGSATSACAIGTSSGESRRSSGGLVEGDQEAEAERHRRDAERQHEERRRGRLRSRRSARVRERRVTITATEQPEQQRHPGGVDGDPQRVHQRVGDRDQQRLVGAGRRAARGSWPGSRRRRRAASRTTRVEDRARPPGRAAPRSATSAGQVAAGAVAAAGRGARATVRVRRTTRAGRPATSSAGDHDAAAAPTARPRPGGRAGRW